MLCQNVCYVIGFRKCKLYFIGCLATGLMYIMRWRCYWTAAIVRLPCLSMHRFTIDLHCDLHWIMAGTLASLDKQWDKIGRSELWVIVAYKVDYWFMMFFVFSVKECQSTQPGKEKLRQLLYDLCNNVINGQLKPESAASALAEVIVIIMNIQFQLF